MSDNVNNGDHVDNNGNKQLTTPPLTFASQAFRSGIVNRCCCNWGGGGDGDDDNGNNNNNSNNNDDCVRFHLYFLRNRDPTYGRPCLAFAVHGKNRKWQQLREAYAVTLLHKDKHHFDLDRHQQQQQHQDQDSFNDYWGLSGNTKGKRIYIAPHHFWRGHVRAHQDNRYLLSTPRPAADVSDHGILDPQYSIIDSKTNRTLYFVLPNHPKSAVAEMVGCDMPMEPVPGYDAPSMPVPPTSNRQLAAVARHHRPKQQQKQKQHQQQQQQRHYLKNRRRLHSNHGDEDNLDKHNENPDQDDDDNDRDHDIPIDHDNVDEAFDSSFGIIAVHDRDNHELRLNYDNDDDDNNVSKNGHASLPFSAAAADNNNNNNSDGDDIDIDNDDRPLVMMTMLEETAATAAVGPSSLRQPKTTLRRNRHGNRDGGVAGQSNSDNYDDGDDQRQQTKFHELTFSQYQNMVFEMDLLRRQNRDMAYRLQHGAGGGGVTTTMVDDLTSNVEKHDNKNRTNRKKRKTLHL